MNAAVVNSEEARQPPAIGRTRPLPFGWIASGIALAGVAFALAWVSGGAPTDASPLPVIAEVPDFELTASDGRRVTRLEFLGKVWVANFIYAQCPGPCPMLSAKMQALQVSLADQKEKVRLASFSLDPLRDTPAVLTDYARRFRAQPGFWYFLTCNDETLMHRIVEKGFLQSVIPAEDDNPMMHSNYMAVVDPAGRIRAFHDGLEPDARERIQSDVLKLLGESAAP